MFNIIRADFIKIKKSSWYNLLVFFWILVFTLIYSFLNSQTINKDWYSWFFLEILWLDENTISINMFLYVFIIFWFSLLVDVFYNLDKSKSLILFTKNIRIKYYLSKIIITLLVSFLILFFISLISSLILFFTSSLFNTELFLLLLKDSFLKFSLFYIAIIPLFILFNFLNLIWIRSIFISIFIMFFYFIYAVFGEKIYESDFWKYFKVINNYTLIWNYNNILSWVYNEKINYVNKKIDSKYLNKEDIEKYKEMKDKIEKLTLISELFYDMDFVNWVEIKNKESKEKFEKISKIYGSWYDNYLSNFEKYTEIYKKLWWDNELFFINNNIENYKNKTIDNYNTISIKSLQNIFSMNNNFYVWFLHLIFLILIWSIIIKKRQVYN